MQPSSFRPESTRSRFLLHGPEGHFIRVPSPQQPGSPNEGPAHRRMWACTRGERALCESGVSPEADTVWRWVSALHLVTRVLQGLLWPPELCALTSPVCLGGRRTHCALLPSQGLKNQARVKLNIVRCPPVTTVLIRRPDLRYQLGFSVQNGIVSTTARPSPKSHKNGPRCSAFYFYF